MHEDIHLDRDVLFRRKLAEFSEHDIHAHDALEISVLLEHEAIYRLAHRDYGGEPGDVFIFRPFEAHWTLVKEPHKPVSWIMILFSPSVVRFIPDGYKLLAPFYAAGTFAPLLPGKLPYAQRIRELTLQAVAEEENGLPGWQAQQAAALIEVLVQLYRCYLDATGQAQAGSIGGPEDGIIRAIEYMLRHFLGEVDPDEPQRLSGLKKTMFYRLFRQATSLPPNEFVIRLRLQHALHLLKTSRMPVTDIALESGFNSLSYFNRVFKDRRGVSPSEWRLSANRARQLPGDAEFR